jgi:hypothetical protein
MLPTNGGTMRTRIISAVVAGTIAVGTLSGCSLLRDDHSPSPTPTKTAASGVDTQIDERTPSPSPPLAAADTVVTEAQVTSPSGDTSIHVQVVANGNDTYRVELSGYRSTVSQPMSIEFRDDVPHTGDGWDPGAVGVRRWEAGEAPTAQYALSAAGRDPSYLRSVVLVPLVADDATSTPSWANHVLAVAPLTWKVGPEYPDLHVTVGKSVPGAYGIVTNNAAGVPSVYLVAHGDEARVVAKRFGITVDQLEWMNPTVYRQDDWLFEGTTLNLDPADR